MISRNRHQRGSSDTHALHPWTKRAVWAVAACLLLVVFVLGWLYWVNWSRYSTAQEQLESRISRLDGILAASADIDTRLSQARAAVGPWLHKGGSEGQNAVLQSLRELVVASGATLVSSQAATVPAESEQKLPKVRVSATVAGEWAQLVQLGQALQAERPPYLVHSLNIQREGQASNKAAHRARLTLQLDAPIAQAVEEAKP
ncbi:general secretion pathway protein GspM [Ottowia sp. GY511]|uniref:Type II secretion system protein GspM n=1 Tax=Ottowia flava TaxID=2675430 RepID=A0ABW4KV32_9BURK|nr:type II secretion system protein GspM [Ottowia sp. GY511]TXK32972.1 general secretion pathway protein GspM [Ottowia sp. GY511]